MTTLRANRMRGSLPAVAGKAREVGSALVYEVVFLVSTMVIFPITAQKLGPEDYGAYTTVYVIAGFSLTWVYSSGGAALIQLLLQANRTGVSALHAGRRQVLYAAVPFGIVGLALTYAVVGDELLVPALLIFGADLFIAGFAEMNLSVIYSLSGTMPATSIRAILPLLRLVGVVGLALFDRVTILSLVIVSMVASASMLVASMIGVRKALQIDRRGAETPTTSRELARYSTAYAMSMSTNAVQNEGEKFVLAAFRPKAEVGEYLAAYRIVSMAYLPLRAVGVAAARWFLPQDERPGAHARKAARLTALLVAYGLVCAVGVVVVQPVSRWVLGSEFETAVSITVWLCALPLLHGTADVPAMGLLGLGRNRVRVYLGLGVSAFAAVAYLVLVPQWGWKGAVAGTYASEAANLLAGWFVLRRCQAEHDVMLAARAVTGLEEA